MESHLATLASDVHLLHVYTIANEWMPALLDGLQVYHKLKFTMLRVASVDLTINLTIFCLVCNVLTLDTSISLFCWFKVAYHSLFI